MIGIGITTRNRSEVFDKTYFEVHRFAPRGSRIVVVDDASDPPAPGSDYRFDSNVGISAAKNECLSLLDDCEHIFLFDDDTYPIAPDWWKPYVESNEPHLMYQFKLPGKPANDMRELYRDDKIVAYSHTRGAMIYVERRVLDVVGGMDTRLNNGYEHPEWTNRIHNAGLTTYRAMDVPNSDELFYCLDQDGKVESSIEKDRISMLENRRLYLKSIGSKEYKEFRT